MKRSIGWFILITFMFSLWSCTAYKKEQGEQELRLKGDGQNNSNSFDNIVDTTLQGTDGNKIHLSFDNVQNIVVVVLDRDTVLLKQDTTASGISYSNKTYKYTEWHREAKLEKEGKVVFSTR